jgi:hypothetical protein
VFLMTPEPVACETERMELREAIRTLDELVDDATMYVEGDATEWSPQSDTGVGTQCPRPDRMECPAPRS